MERIYKKGYSLGIVVRKGIYKEETFTLGTEGLRDRQQVEGGKSIPDQGHVRLQTVP